MNQFKKPTLQESHFGANSLQKRIVMAGAVMVAGIVAFSTANILHAAFSRLILS